MSVSVRGRGLPKTVQASLLALAALAASLAPAGADQSVTEATLQGAWAIDALNCSDVFVFKNGKASFAKDQGDYESGFIVDGRQVRGLAESCRVASKRVTKSGTVLSLNCASEVSELSRTEAARLIDGQTLVISDPAAPEVAITYKRCSP